MPQLLNSLLPAVYRPTSKGYFFIASGRLTSAVAQPSVCVSISSDRPLPPALTVAVTPQPAAMVLSGGMDACTDGILMRCVLCVLCVCVCVCAVLRCVCVVCVCVCVVCVVL